MAPPPRAPLPGSAPPVAPPPPKPAHTSRAVAPPPSSSASSQPHVKFASPKPKSLAPTRASAPAKGVDEAVVEITHRQYPEFQINTTSNGGPGYIRVRGGLQTTRYHNYDGLIPTQDLLRADSAQQATLLNAMLAAQLESTASRDGRHSRSSDVSKQPRTNVSQADHPKSLPPPTQAPVSPPTLTAANLEKASKPPSTNSSALTSISRRHHSSSDHRGTTAISTKASKTPKLRCCNCGQSKKPDIDNVKMTGSGVPLCWQCHARFEGSDGVREWLART